MLALFSFPIKQQYVIDVVETCSFSAVLFLITSKSIFVGQTFFVMLIFH